MTQADAGAYVREALKLLNAGSDTAYLLGYNPVTDKWAVVAALRQARTNIWHGEYNLTPVSNANTPQDACHDALILATKGTQ